MEPQDHRLNLPWKHQDDGIWTEPAIPGAAPMLVLTAQTTVEGLHRYLASLHNDRLGILNSTSDVRQRAQDYANQQRPSDPVEVKAIVADTYTEAYNAGWELRDAIHQEDLDRALAQNRSLKDQVAAAERRADTTVRTTQQVQEGRDGLAAELRNMREARDRVAADNALLRSQVEELRGAFNGSQTALQQAHQEHGETMRRLTALEKRHADLAEKHADLEQEHADLQDDARIACSLSSSPGARDAAMERIRRHSGAIQDQVEQYARDFEELAAEATQRVADALDLPRELLESTDAYDRGVPLHGVGHHSPSYAKGYAFGRSDTTHAYRDPMNERDQALYAAHLLLAESVAANDETATQWKAAVRRWREGYFGLVSTEDQA